MGFFDDIKSGIMRKVNNVTGNITSAVSDAVSGIAEEVSRARYEGKLEDGKSDLRDLPYMAGRCIVKQKQITNHLHYLVITDEKKRQEYHDMIKSLCGELDKIEKEFFKIREDFKFSNDNDYEMMKAESDELEKLYSPAIEKYKNVSRDLYAAIDEVNDFIYGHKKHFSDRFERQVRFFGTYQYAEMLDYQIKIQQSFWRRAQWQYEDPEMYKTIIEMSGSDKCPF